MEENIVGFLKVPAIFEFPLVVIFYVEGVLFAQLKNVELSIDWDPIYGLEVNPFII
jgi:hypothetical protein